MDLKATKGYLWSDYLHYKSVLYMQVIQKRQMRSFIQWNLDLKERSQLKNSYAQSFFLTPFIRFKTCFFNQTLFDLRKTNWDILNQDLPVLSI